MKQLNLFLLITIAALTNVVNAQDFTIESISYHKELYVDQGYQNNPPTGYKASYTCPDTLTFCVIKGKFSEGTKISSEKIQLKLEDNSIAKVVGSVKNKNIPEIKTYSYRENLSGNDAPIFIVKNGVKPKQLIIGEEEISVNAKKENVEFNINNIPGIEIISVKLFDQIIDEKVEIKTGGFSDGNKYPVELKYVPVKGKVLCIEAKITNVRENSYPQEIAVYDDNSFVSNAFATQGAFGLSTFGGLKDSGYRPSKLYFIVGSDFAKGDLYYNDTYLLSFKVD
ncbi:MAG: hypothetical protein JW866_09815 [Ignavibacteriales bacterium]|nr:hypothetical protein [Ignavibacteriales bacterium]